MKQLAAQMAQVGAMLQTMVEQISSSSSPVQQRSNSDEVDAELEDESKDEANSSKCLKDNGVVSPTTGIPEP
ncbi:unnamed protein product [Linum trigynum]|uniref:Uncharacterized protein n=1 Tax=Linum trigynum TaxID=586398 RepID=A0AAV2D0F3_9ROSI